MIDHDTIITYRDVAQYSDDELKQYLELDPFIFGSRTDVRITEIRELASESSKEPIESTFTAELHEIDEINLNKLYSLVVNYCTQHNYIAPGLTLYRNISHPKASNNAPIIAVPLMYDDAEIVTLIEEHQQDPIWMDYKKNHPDFDYLCLYDTVLDISHDLEINPPYIMVSSFGDNPATAYFINKHDVLNINLLAIATYNPELICFTIAHELRHKYQQKYHHDMYPTHNRLSDLDREIRTNFFPMPKLLEYNMQSDEVDANAFACKYIKKRGLGGTDILEDKFSEMYREYPDGYAVMVKKIEDRLQEI